MSIKNEMSVNFSGISQNEAFARVVIAAFVSQLNPSVNEITDIKTSVSEAVTNAIIHGYEKNNGEVTLSCKIMENNTIEITVLDNGTGIEDIEQAKEPLYTSKPEMERSGLGFTVMETFMDKVEIISRRGLGTKIIMTKKLS